eukprot:758509_1
MGIPTNEVPADPALLMRSLEGSNVVYVTPDAQWITPKQPLPPLDPASSKRPLPVNFRSQSVTIPAGAVAVAAVSPTPTKPVSENVDEKTIILENVSSELPVENIMAALTFGNVVPKSARSEAGNKWYVVFASVPDARAAIVASKDKLIEGNPINARIKVEVQNVNPGPRKISPPNSAAAAPSPRQVNPIVALNQQQQQQLPPQHQMAQMQQVQVNGRPNMVSRSQSGPAHYNLNNGQPVPHNMPTHPQGMPMPAGAVPGYPYAYGYRNMPAPGNYQQTGFVYPNHIQQVPQQGAPQMQYMYPGYTYVAAGSPNYYPQGVGRPVLMRDNSARSQRSLPYENGHLVRTVGNNRAGAGTGGGTRRQDGKKDRKNRNKKGL